MHDFEVEVNVRLPKSNELLEQQFLIDLEDSKEIFIEDWKKRRWYQNLIGRVLLYINT